MYNSDSLRTLATYLALGLGCRARTLLFGLLLLLARTGTRNTLRLLLPVGCLFGHRKLRNSAWYAELLAKLDERRTVIARTRSVRCFGGGFRHAGPRPRGGRTCGGDDTQGCDVGNRKKQETHDDNLAAFPFRVISPRFSPFRFLFAKMYQPARRHKTTYCSGGVSRKATRAQARVQGQLLPTNTYQVPGSSLVSVRACQDKLVVCQGIV